MYGLMLLLKYSFYYGKCPKISYTKVSDKIAYAHDYSSVIRVVTVCHSMMKLLHKRQNLIPKSKE